MERPLSFTIANYSEQFVKDKVSGYLTYSAVMHVDGEIFQWREAIPEGYCPPLSDLRVNAWVRLLKAISEKLAGLP